MPTQGTTDGEVELHSPGDGRSPGQGHRLLGGAGLSRESSGEKAAIAADPRIAARDGDWKLALTADGARVELHRLTEDRAEAKDLAKEHPEIGARLKQLALDWKATLPEKPNPACISAVDRADAKLATTKAAPNRAPAFSRWDTNKDEFLSFDEYKAGLKGQDNLEGRFKNFDKNGDGNVSREEFVSPSVNSPVPKNKTP